jgi:hypothetical protein
LAKYGESEISFTTLDATDIGPINARLIRQMLLSPIKGLPFLSDPLSKGF